MKKLLLSIAMTLVVTSGLHAMSRSDIAREITSALGNLQLNALDPRESVAKQQTAVTNWTNAVDKAKKFVVENSKDLLKKVDPDLAQGLSKLDQLNNDFTNTIKTIRGTMPNAPISKLLPISNDAKKLGEQFRSKSFVLSGKKDAALLISVVAECIASGAKYLYNDLLSKKR